MTGGGAKLFEALQLFDLNGRRKYLSEPESERFLAAAQRVEPSTRALAELLAYSGCRISEALELTGQRLDPGAGVVVFRTLKRRRLCYRAVPIPDALMANLLGLASEPDRKLWLCCRQTAWRRIKRLMREAAIEGTQASPKGLRHRFGVLAAERVPLTLAQRWMGHAKPETTAIYQQVTGVEERRLAERLWPEAGPVPI